MPDLSPPKDKEAPIPNRQSDGPAKIGAFGQLYNVYGGLKIALPSHIFS